MPITDIKNWLHGKAAPTTGVAIGASGDEYSEDELDFETAYPGFAKGGADVGLHMVINESFNTLTSVMLTVAHGAATAPTTVLVSRYFVLADLVAGKHYYVPMPPSVLRYVRALFDLTGSNPTTGKVCMWIGPRTGGEL